MSCPHYTYITSYTPRETYVWKNAFRSVDHQWNSDRFATGGAGVDIWNHNRSAPEQSYQWGTDTVVSVRFNPGEPDILATSARYVLMLIDKICITILVIKTCTVNRLDTMCLLILVFGSGYLVF
ncbi:hypothetical protein DVH24_016506 [Malus domestica]|uniref:Uncharacterized protein n=1 Tax=Malus domestica TaxID=3750 RepID=A0A498HTT9_MALDO|nr:hypothetical protein DVH24_016506 [Malus domestica]